jgi:phage terminase large subunit
MNEIRIQLIYQPKQLQAKKLLDESGVYFLGYGGSRGGGKSKFIRNYTFEKCMQIANLRVIIIRKKYGDLQRNYIDKFKQEFPFLKDCYNSQLHRFTFPNGSTIDLGYLQYAKDLDNFQGAEFDIICLDEATQHEEFVFNKLRACRRSTIPGWIPKFILTCNPGGIGHVWFKKVFIDPFTKNALPDGYGFVQATVDDNKYLGKDYVDDLEKLPEKLRRAWRYGDWTVFEGMFFPEFGGHLKESPYIIQPHDCNIYGSLDYGEGDSDRASATSFGLHHIDKMGKPHRLFTYYKKHQSASIYAREIVAAVQSFHWTSGIMPKMTFADPSVFIKRKIDETYVKSVGDVFREHGLPLVPANNDRVNGWRIVRESYKLDTTGVPNSFYWDGYNAEYEMYMPTLMHAETNPDDVEKGGEDHCGDEHRYFTVAAMSMGTAMILKQAKANKRTDYNSALSSMLKSGSIGDCGI